MATDLGLVSPTKLQKLAQHHQTLNNPSSSSTATTTVSSSPWMWNPKQPTGEDDDSWEVRAFAEDTNQAMGTTWPPRSYTCTFCRREFRSAQALGGHMNVHRRDRARLHQAPTGPISPTSPSAASSSSSTLIIPTQELVTNGTGLCLLYSLPNPKDMLSPTTRMNTSTDSSSNLLSISPYPPKNLISSPCPPPPINFPVASPSTKTEPSGSIDDDNNQNHSGLMITGELDLELRLGRSSSPS